MHPADREPADLRRGFVEEEGAYRCIFCGEATEVGVVYPVGGRLLDAARAAAEHVDAAHGGVAAALLALGREATGLSEVQHHVLTLLLQGASDADIARALGGRSPSTVRNHRFQLRRRHREAKIQVTLMELVHHQELVQFHAALPVDDDRTVVTTSEAEALLARYFGDPERTSLLRFPKKEKHKLVVLRHLVQRFEPGQRYPEKQVNARLSEAFADTATLRRYLVDYGFMAREPDGSAYWRTDG